MFLSDGSPTLIGRKQQISARREPDSVKSAAATIRTPFANLHAKPRAQITPRSPRAPFFHPRPPLLQLQGLLTTFGGFRGGGRGDIRMARGGGGGFVSAKPDSGTKAALPRGPVVSGGWAPRSHARYRELSLPQPRRATRLPRTAGVCPPPRDGTSSGAPGPARQPGAGGGSGGAGAPGSRL